MGDVSLRIKAYIENGWADRVINPDLSEGVAVTENQDNLTLQFYPQLKEGKASKVLINHWRMYQNFH